MIVFTEPGDTPESVAHRHLGYNDASKAEQIKDINRHSFAWEIMNNSGFYAANRALWFPVDGEETLDWEKEAIVHEFDWLTSEQRATLAAAQKHDLEIHDILAGHAFSTLANGIFGAGTALSLDSLHSSIDIRYDRMEKFEKSMDDVKAKFNLLSEAKSTEATAVARKDFGKAYRNLLTEFESYLVSYTAKDMRLLRRPRSVIRLLNKKGWQIDNLFEAKQITKVASYLKYLKGAGGGLLLIMGATKVHETWEHTHNLEATLKEANEEIADILVTVALTRAALFLLVFAGITSPEWGTCLLVGSAATGGAFLLNKLAINPLIEKM
jgi:hypothetical protein